MIHSEFTLCIQRQGSNFIIPHVATQLCQHHLLKRHWNCLGTLCSKLIGPKWVIISEAPFHWSTSLIHKYMLIYGISILAGQYHTAWFHSFIVFWNWSMSLPLCSFKTALATRGGHASRMNFRISCKSLLKEAEIFDKACIELQINRRCATILSSNL